MEEMERLVEAWERGEAFWRRGFEGREVTRGWDERRRGQNEFGKLTLYYVMVGDLGGWFISIVWIIQYHWMVHDENFLRKQDKIGRRREWVWERQTSNVCFLGIYERWKSWRIDYLVSSPYKRAEEFEISIVCYLRMENEMDWESLEK